MNFHALRVHSLDGFNNPSMHDYGHPINEGINQRNLKIWADVADKICFGRT